MREILKIIPAALYILTGTVSMVMAVKSLLADKYLPFHEQAAGKHWNEIDPSLKPVILSLLRLGGLGFLVVSILLIVCTVVNYYVQNVFYRYAVPSIALIYCSGLAINNYMLYKSTKAGAPWKGSLYGALALTAGIALSIFSNSPEH